MSVISCLIQAEGAAAGMRQELEKRLRDNHAARFDGADVAVTWRLVETGLMYTAGSPSCSAVIACAIPGPTTLLSRKTYMRTVCDFWTELTGCTDHEVVVSITEIEPEALQPAGA